jgi:methylthioribose-1-phosphate isomerase
MKLNALKSLTLVWGPLSEEAATKLKSQDSLVLVAENRPSLLGLKHNIPILKKEQVDFIYCTDNALGLLFYKQKIKKTLIFSKDRLKGVSGSLYAALLSKIHNVPVEIMEQGSIDLKALDRDASTLGGKDFILEDNKEEYIIRQDLECIDKGVLG